MQFKNLILIFSTPSWWRLHDDERTSSGFPDPLSHGEKLRDMLGAIFKSTQGHAALGVLDPVDRTVREWLSGSDALAWVDSIYETVWRPHEEAMAASGLEPVPERAYEAFRAQPAIIFFDGVRLDSCIDRDGLVAFAKEYFDPEAIGEGTPQGKLPSDEIAADLVPPLPDVYASLRLDWTHRKGGVGSPGYITWEPQMCLFNYWPESTNLAPPPEGARPQPAVVEPARAAEIMEEDFFKRVHRRFEAFRNMQYRLGTAEIGQFRTPVFYFAAPTELPDDPADYLSGRPVVSIRPFTSLNLGVNDPLSDQMTGGVIDGAFLVLRREIVPTETNSVYDFLVMFPSNSIRGDWSAVEARLASITDFLSYANFHARDMTVGALRVADEFEPELGAWEARAAIWDRLLDAAAGLTAELQRELASSRHRKSEVFQLVNRLQLALARMQRSIMAGADAVSRWDRNVQRAVDRASDSAARRAGALPFRGVPMLKRLPEVPDEDGSYRMISEQLARPRLRGRLQVAEAEELRRRVESQRVVAAEMLGVERWQEQERADTNQKRLTYGVAVLTLFAVFPLIIGHLDWNALHDALSNAPGAVRWTLSVANFMHRWTVGLVLIFGCAVTAGLVALMLAQPILGRRRRDPTPVRARLGATWEVVERNANPSSESFTREDSKVCTDLVEIQEALRRERPIDGNIDRLERLKEDIDRFLVRIELLANRPEEFRLPAAILLLRHYGGSFFGEETQGGGVDPPVLATDAEVAGALLREGFSEEEAMRIGAVAAGAAKGPIDAFVKTVAEELGQIRAAHAAHVPTAVIQALAAGIPQEAPAPA